MLNTGFLPTYKLILATLIGLLIKTTYMYQKSKSLINPQGLYDFPPDLPPKFSQIFS